MGRLIVGAFYLYNAGNHVAKFGQLSEYAGFKGVPFPEMAVAGSALLLLIGGITLLLGVFPDIGIIALVLFFLPVTFMVHNFWAVTGEQQAAEMINFTKNLALMGSALMFLGIKKPWPLSLASFRANR